jgi:hypothetical protein
MSVPFIGISIRPMERSGLTRTLSAYASLTFLANAAARRAGWVLM